MNPIPVCSTKKFRNYRGKIWQLKKNFYN
jgi:hypothetical protein